MLHLVFYCPPFSLCSPNTHELVAKLGFTGSANIDLTFWSHVCILVLWRFCQKWNNFFFQESNRSSSRKVPRLSRRLLLKSKQGLVFGLMMPRSAGNEKYCLTGTQTTDTCLCGNTSTLRFYCCFFVLAISEPQRRMLWFLFCKTVSLFFIFCVQNEQLYKHRSLTVKWV